MTAFRTSSSLLITLFISALFFAAAAQAQIQLSASIEMDTEQTGIVKSFGWGEDLFVNVSLVNDGDEEAYFLKYNTPFFGLDREVFRVLRDGEEATYLGRIAEFSSPTAESYLALAAGESISERIEISKYYDMSKPGNYSIAFSSMFQHVLGREPSSDIPFKEVISAPTQIYYAGREQDLYSAMSAEDRARALASEALFTTKAGGNTFTGCSSNRQTKLAEARNKGYNMADEVNDVLDGHTLGLGGNTYTDYFGANSPSRHGIVEGNYEAIRSGLDNATIDFICLPTGGDCELTTDSSGSWGVTAYVYPARIYDIHICEFFWDVHTTKKKRGGLLIHEMSHFNNIGDTNDYVYGASNCRDLADEDPSKAIRNADTYEVYALKKN